MSAGILLIGHKCFAIPLKQTSLIVLCPVKSCECAKTFFSQDMKTYNLLLIVVAIIKIRETHKGSLSLIRFAQRLGVF